MDIDGSVAVVTGGASGLGCATAARLQSRGARVVVIDLPASAPTSLSELGPDLTYVSADVCDPVAVAGAIDQAASLGPPRILVNCAGIGDPTRILAGGEPVDLDRFRRVIEVNLIGTFNVIRLAAAAIARTDEVGREERTGDRFGLGRECERLG
ncbi:SDR family NAD(P)-dependent oxidoreductase [Gordonia paraffinivorans]|uniref:SDR family NAD(P)-dependent oxidoreductase n=1 Tax=Gordonia paraffinivorans TaxID=175628 RepID=UPI001446C728|nr:SDR family NAD(P)-dependent oxidoreductase [Gordonia paraffinivorans]